MNCSKCATAIPDGSAFCNKCGAPTSPAAAIPVPRPQASSEPEEELWRGRVSAKVQAHWVFLWMLASAAVGYVWLAVLEPDMRAKRVVQYACIAVVGIPLLMIFWSVMVDKLSTRYRLTTHRLFKETGIIARHHNEIELIRVDDVAVRQNLLQRIFNVGVITVIAPSDQTEPRLELLGIENPIEIKEQIRAQVRKRRDRSLHVESL